MGKKYKKYKNIMKKFNNFKEINEALTISDDSVSVQSFKIKVNLYQSIGTASDESEKEFHDWFFKYDFGTWEAEVFDRVHYSVIILELSNINEIYDDYRNIVEIVQKNAKLILKPLSH